MGMGAKLSASMDSGKHEGADGMELKAARGALSVSMESDKDEGAVMIVNDYAQWHNKLWPTNYLAGLKHFHSQHSTSSHDS